MCKLILKKANVETSMIKNVFDIYIYTYIYIYIHTYIYINMYICMCVCICVYVCIRGHAHVPVYV